LSDKKKILLMGLSPAAVDFSRWPGMTAEKLEAGLQAGEKQLIGAGYDATMCYLDDRETVATIVEQKLAGSSFDCVLIGAGVRIDPEELLLFEKLINVVHQHAPNAKICFNTGPTDLAEAVQRWV
jgi:hypothetical protein